MRNCLLVILLVLIGDTAFAVVKPEAVPFASHQQVDSMIAKAISARLKNPGSARKMAEHALMISKKTDYNNGIGHSLYAIGITYWVQSHFSISQFYLNMALPYLNGDDKGLVNCYKSIGRNYVDLKNYDKALQSFNKGLKLVKNNIISKAEIYTELTSMYYANGDYNNCLRYVDTALKYTRLTGRKQLTGILYNRLGQVYIEQNKIDLAERMLDTCYQLNLEIKNRRLQTVWFMDKARIDILKGNVPSAVNYCHRAYMLADTLGTVELKLRALKMLSAIYKKQNNAAQVSLLQNNILQLYEGMDKINNEKNMQLVQDYFVLSDKLNLIEITNRNNVANQKVQNRTITLLVVLLVTAIIFLVIIFVYYKQKNQMNTRLQAQHKVLLDQKKMIEIQRTDLEDINNLKNKLLAIIGHDLRTPIASLSSIADLFAVEYITADEVQKIMQDLTPTIKGAELTLTNLMEFADSQIKGHQVTSSHIDVCAVIDEMEETFKYQLKQKNIAFINNCQQNQTVWADANHIKVVLRNLISNAIKFTSNGGHIKLTSTAKNNEVVLCVEDTGVGMTLAEVNKLFDVNMHFSQNGTSGEKGTGLGLLLCKELVTLNNGKLWAASSAGEGSNFYFTLPLYLNANSITT